MDDEAKLKRLTEAAERLALISPNNKSTSSITIEAGGIGVWIVVTCFAASVVMNICLAVAVLNHDRKIDELKDYISAIYMLAPHLKPEGYP